MNSVEDGKKKIFYLFLFIFFGILFMCYNDPLENIFLLISFNALITLLKSLREINSYRKLLTLVIIAVFFYIVTLLFIYTKEYKMVISNKSDNVVNGNSILIVYEGEGEKYDIHRSLTNISIDGDILKKLKTPFLLYRNKNNYKEIGRSNYSDNTDNIKEKLSRFLNEGDKIYIGYLKDKYYVEEKVFQIIRDGYRNITIVPIVLSENGKYYSLKKRIEKLKFYNINIKIKYTEPLWNSERIVLSYIEKLSKYISRDKINDIGVILIGEPVKISKEDSSYLNALKQDLMFREKIKNYLVNNMGIDDKKVRLAWFELSKPSYVDETYKLLEYGVGDILCIYVKPGCTNIENSIIVSNIKNSIDIPEGVKIKVIDGFLNDDNYIQELRRRIEFINLQK